MNILITSVLFLALVFPLHAAENQGDYETRLLVGSFRPKTRMSNLDSDDQLASAGLAIGGRFLAKLSPHWSLGGEIESLAPSKHTSAGLITNFNSTSRFSSLLFMTNVRISSSSEKIRPYGLAGAGIHRTSLRIDTTPNAGIAWRDTGTRETRSVIDTSTIGLATTLQCGVDLSITDRLMLGISGAFYYLPPTTYASTAQAKQLAPGFIGVDGDISGLALMGNLVFQF